jgi:lipopolysaccharide export system protein LptA
VIRGEFHHQSGVAIYTGNARAWQDDNFVRGDKLTMYMNEKKMDANGRVQSAVYNARRKDTGATTLSLRLLIRCSTPIRTPVALRNECRYPQAPDRITSNVADVYLAKETNEMEKTIAQGNVVMTQPARKGVGDWMQYTTTDEVAILKGNPARVDDAEKGNTEGARLTVYLRDGRVVADDPRGPQTAGFGQYIS